MKQGSELDPRLLLDLQALKFGKIFPDSLIKAYPVLDSGSQATAVASEFKPLDLPQREKLNPDEVEGVIIGAVKDLNILAGQPNLFSHRRGEDVVFRGGLGSDVVDAVRGSGAYRDLLVLLREKTIHHFPIATTPSIMGTGTVGIKEITQIEAQDQILDVVAKVDKELSEKILKARKERGEMAKVQKDTEGLLSEARERLERSVQKMFENADKIKPLLNEAKLYQLYAIFPRKIQKGDGAESERNGSIVCVRKPINLTVGAYRYYFGFFDATTPAEVAKAVSDFYDDPNTPREIDTLSKMHDFQELLDGLLKDAEANI